MTSIQADGATQTVYIRQITGTSQYSTDQTSWNSLTWPVTVTNTNGTPASNILKVLFTTDLTLDNGTDSIIVNSAGIQIGDTSVRNDGTRPVITISVNNYPGFIRNGTGGSSGYNHVYVYNLNVIATGYTTTISGGWIGQRYFGKGATNNFIVNCSSSGDISDYGGGIVGAEAGSESGELVLRSCSSYGDQIGEYSGGISGHYAGYLGSVTCERCWSEGLIEYACGGIYGVAGVQGSAVATKCYSIGSISSNGGGIFGTNAGDSLGVAIAQDCYSRGTIGMNAGGIFGSDAGSNLGITISATNCYSSGSIAGGGDRGVYGTGKSGGASTSSCYSADGSWNSSTAQTTLNMNTYISVGINQPFELRAFGPSPYSLTTIVSNDTRVTFSQTVTAGSSSSSGVLSGISSYSILSGSHPTISINSSTGTISTTSATPVGTYTITVRADISSYSITTFTLTVTAASPGRLDLKGKQFDFKTYTNIQEGQRFVIERNGSPNIRFNSFAEYNKYLIANSAFRR